jgi:hypothetical protein
MVILTGHEVKAKEGNNGYEAVKRGRGSTKEG